MTTGIPNKTDSVVVLAHQLATHDAGAIVGSAIDVSTKRSVTIFLYHGYIEDTADTDPGKFKVQVRPDAGSGSDTEHWITVFEGVAKGTNPDFIGMDAVEPVGETVLAVTSTTGFTLEDLLYVLDVVTLASSEWAEIAEIVTNTTITLVDGLTVEKPDTGELYNDASKFIVSLDLNSIESFRVLWIHEGGTGADGHVKALAITYDSDDFT